jgi:hypothetical protein
MRIGDNVVTIFQLIRAVGSGSQKVKLDDFLWNKIPTRRVNTCHKGEDSEPSKNEPMAVKSCNYRS